MPQENHYSIKTIVETDNPEKLVQEGLNLARQLRQGESTKTQIRKLFGTLRQIEMSWPIRKPETPEESRQLDDAYRQLVLFGPRLAYVAGQHPAIKELANTIQEGIKYVKKDDSRTLKRLVQFFEAVVAYYTARA